jgi:hypothetical protein
LVAEEGVSPLIEDDVLPSMSIGVVVFEAVMLSLKLKLIRILRDRRVAELVKSCRSGRIYIYIY